MAVGNPRLWKQLCAAVDAEDLEHDPRFATNDDRMAHRETLNAELEQRVSHMSRHQLIERLRAQMVPCGEVRTVAEALDDPQLAARDMIIELPHPTLGPVQTLGNPIKLSRTPAQMDRPPPALGEHTKEVLQEPRSVAEEGGGSRYGVIVTIAAIALIVGLAARAR